MKPIFVSGGKLLEKQEIQNLDRNKDRNSLALSNRRKRLPIL